MIINEAILSKYPLLENLPIVIKNSLENGEISLKTALALAELSANEGEYLTEVIRKYYLGVNKQQELIKLVTEIEARDNISLKDFLPGIEKEIIERNLKESGRGAFLVSRLREKRYPKISAFRKELEGRKNLFKNKGFNLILPPNLEEEGFKIEIFFKDSGDLINKIEKLKEILEH
ncbi:MAG: hypothetical protein AB1498_01765 [bacterium]